MVGFLLLQSWHRLHETRLLSPISRLISTLSLIFIIQNNIFVRFRSHGAISFALNPGFIVRLRTTNCIYSRVGSEYLSHNKIVVHRFLLWPVRYRPKVQYIQLSLDLENQKVGQLPPCRRARVCPIA